MEPLDDIATDVLQQLTAAQAWHYQVLPYSFDARRLWVYGDGARPAVREELEFLLGREVIFEALDDALLRQALARHYRTPAADAAPRPAEAFNARNGIDLDALLAEAKGFDASDVHFEPYEYHCRIRFRIDGVLVERYRIDHDAYPALANKIKIRANLDIAEKRLPQDGRIFFRAGDQKFDVRVSALPTLHGEKMVLRLLSGNETRIDLDHLGFSAGDLERFLDGIARPNGMVLISGPTGSGKTTTLYAALQRLNNRERNIVTIEDPIEYTLEGVNQVQLREAIGLDFASALRTFLRQDPDVIMVGEVRDVGTANMAIRASLTGHLVLSTIHTNSAWGIVARLLDMGTPAYLLSDTLNTAVAQRLVRVLCPHCKKEGRVEDLKFPRQFAPPYALQRVYEPVGCERCFFTGYHGRKAVYEVIAIDADLAASIKETKLDARETLKRKGVVSLAENAFRLLADGQTSLREAYPILIT